MAGRTPKSKVAKQRKVAKVMKEFKLGTLKSYSGKNVTSHKQAVAIAMSESGQSNAKKKTSRKISSKKKTR